MSWAALLACLWVLAATLVAFLPMRRQFAPGLALLIVAPAIIIWLTSAINVWVGLAALVGFISMFRNPLRYIAKRAFEKIIPAAKKEGE
ncbi:MAG: DUF2484 family protein [Albidovulum sp.]